jgi:hypothetical protein
MLFARRKTGKAKNDAMPPKVRMVAPDGKQVFEPSHHGHPWAKKGANLQPMYHPGIEVTSSILQCKFPPFSAKSVHPSVNLPMKDMKAIIYGNFLDCLSSTTFCTEGLTALSVR